MDATASRYAAEAAFTACLYCMYASAAPAATAATHAAWNAHANAPRLCFATICRMIFRGYRCDAAQPRARHRQRDGGAAGAHHVTGGEVSAPASLASLTSLAGKVALVTGGGQGIGEAISLRLAEAGAAVVVTDLVGANAERTAARIREAGGRAQGVAADVSSVADAERCVFAAVQVFGRLDVLVNNAALIGASPVMDITESLWDRVIDIDLKGVFFQSQAAARQMIRQGGGKIINIASVDAILPVGGLVPYDSAKGGVAMMTKSLAKELGRHGITVNAVAPGGVKTPGAEEATPMIMKVLGIDAEAMANSPIRSTLGRYAEPDDIAKVVYFLATGLADYMTGAFVTVDGGYLLI